MHPATIAKQRSVGPGSPFAIALGSAIRARRLELGLSQREAAGPLSKTFLSLVERGLMTPSLGSFTLVAGNLGIAPPELLARALAGIEYTQRDA
ncbi:MAG: helix-turn-helix transcriptional regulator [Chloroflexota bacterium]